MGFNLLKTSIVALYVWKSVPLTFLPELFLIFCPSCLFHLWFILQLWSLWEIRCQSFFRRFCWFFWLIVMVSLSQLIWKRVRPLSLFKEVSMKNIPTHAFDFYPDNTSSKSWNTGRFCGGRVRIFWLKAWTSLFLNALSTHSLHERAGLSKSPLSMDFP